MPDLWEYTNWVIQKFKKNPTTIIKNCQMNKYLQEFLSLKASNTLKIRQPHKMVT